MYFRWFLEVKAGFSIEKAMAKAWTSPSKLFSSSILLFFPCSVYSLCFVCTAISKSKMSLGHCFRASFILHDEGENQILSSFPRQSLLPRVFFHKIYSEKTNTNGCTWLSQSLQFVEDLGWYWFWVMCITARASLWGWYAQPDEAFLKLIVVSR